MYDLTRAEWSVLYVLWENRDCSLASAVEKLNITHEWSRNTVHTYLARMEDKGLVSVNRLSSPHKYNARISRDECAKLERDTLVRMIYNGDAAAAIIAILHENNLSPKQKEDIKNML